MSALPWIGVPILALCLGHVFSNMVRTLPAVAVDVMGRDLGLSAEALAQVTGLFPLAFAAAMLPIGVAMDRYGVRRTSRGLLAVAGLGAALAAIAPTPLGMVLAQIVLGAGCSGMLMCPMAWAALALPAARFALWAGIIQAVGNTGMLISASPLALLVEVEGWRAAYLAAAGLAALALLAVSAFVPADAPAATEQRSLREEVRQLLAIAARPAMRGVIVLVFSSFAAVLGLRGLWGGPWLMEVKGLPRVEAGHILLGVAVALTVGPLLAGFALRRFGRPVALLAGSHLMAAAFIVALVALAPLGLPVAVDVALLVGFGFAIGFQVLGFAIVRAVVSPAETGRALSAANCSFFLGAGLLQAASGLAAGWGGIAAALLTFPLALILCALGFLALSRRLPAHTNGHLQ